MTEQFEVINLREWPFSVPVTLGGAQVWAGRPEFPKRAQRLVWSASRVPSSRLILLWSSFGAGKTHALRHLESLAGNSKTLVPIFAVVPAGVKSFVDVYRSIATPVVARPEFRERGLRLMPASDEIRSDVDRAAISVAARPPAEAAVASAWLRAERVPITELRRVGLSRRIETTTDAVEALQQIFGTLTSGDSRHVLLLVDEVQELSSLGQRLNECMSALHKVFDQSSSGLTIVLSFTTTSQATVRGIVGDALFSRVSESLTLPVLTPDEGYEFGRELIAAHSLEVSRAPFPFTEGALRGVVQRVGDSRVDLTPRELIKAFDYVLRETLYDLETGSIRAIDEALACELSDRYAKESLPGVS